MSQMSDFLEVELRRTIFRSNPSLGTIGSFTVRAGSTAYVLGERVILDTTNPSFAAGRLNIYECTVAGTSASGAGGTFNTTLGSTTTDGGVTWLTLFQGMPKRPLWISLHSGTPPTPPSDIVGTEVSGGNYGRAQLDPGDANWSAPDTTQGVTANNSDITYPPPSATWGTGQLTHFGLWDRQTGGNMLAWGPLTTPKSVNGGDPAPKFPASSLTFTFA